MGLSQAERRTLMTQDASPMVTTYSMWNLFRNCRKACELRYHRSTGSDGARPQPALRFADPRVPGVVCAPGSVTSRGCSISSTGRCAARAQDEDQKRDWHLATAMMRGYAAWYASRGVRCRSRSSDVFEGPHCESGHGRFIAAASAWRARSMASSGSAARAFHSGAQDRLAGRCRLSRTALDRLPDRRSTPATWNRRWAFPSPASSTTSSSRRVCSSPRGETEAEFEARRADLIAKSKTGK
jgi:hypothetical protein